MATYPSHLPSFRVGMRYNDEDNFIRTEMESGPDRVRKTKTKGTRVFFITSRMNQDEVSYFEYFISSEINGTEDSFSIDIPISGTDKTHTVFMTEKPDIRYIGHDVWDVSFNLETEDIQYVLSYDELYYYIELADGNIGASDFDDIHLLAQTTLFTLFDSFGDSSTWP